MVMERYDFERHFNAHTTTGYQLTGNLDEGKEGSQAWVFSCVDSDNVPLAAKVFKQNHDEGQLQQFQDEARRLNSLRHPNILAVSWLDTHTVHLKGPGGFTLEQKRPFMIMERADCSLRDRMNQGRLPTVQAVSYSIQAMEGLAFVHEKTANGRRIIHRDIKPGNLLLFGDTIKIADFGIAIMGHSGEKSFTSTHMAAGTGPYMPLEQFDGRATSKSDQWSLAAVLYETLAGQKPITLKNTGELDEMQLWYAWYKAHLNQTIPPLKKVLNGRVDKVADYVQKPLFKALSEKPEDRFESVRAFQDAVMHAFSKGVQQEKLDRRYIDAFLGSRLPVSSTDKTILLHPPTLQLPREAADPANYGKRLRALTESVTRRRSLLKGIVGLGGIAVLSADALPRPAEASLMSSEAYERLQLERKAITDIAHRMGSLLEEKRHAFKKASYDPMRRIGRELIPYEPEVITNLIEHYQTLESMQGETEHLATYMVPYNPAGMQNVMQNFAAREKYAEAAVVGAQLASFSRSPGAAGGDWHSEVEKLSNAIPASEWPDTHKMLTAALHPTDAFAAATLADFETRDVYWTARSLGLAMARHDPAAVNEQAHIWIKRANVLKESDEVRRDYTYETAEELCRALVPYRPDMVIANLENIDDTGVSGNLASDVIQRITLDLLASRPEAVVAYAKDGKTEAKNWPTDHWHQEAAMALGRVDPPYLTQLREKSTEPFASWLGISIDPLDTRLVDGGFQILSNDVTYIEEYAIDIMCALLKSRQPPIKR